jgi:filamentous hemagglutinin family protein
MAMRMKKTTRKQLRTIRRRRLALALVGAMAMPMMPVMAQSLPNSGSVVNGTVAPFEYNGNEMTITQTTKGAIIDWGSFNIGAGYGVTFDQQFGNTSVTLNRVVGFGYSSSASLIDGTLTSNGNVFIINPAGITFGSGAQVNVGGIVASTLWMNSGDFINGLATGQYVFSGFNGDTSTFHEVRNDGTITAGAGGVGLVGQSIRNGGSITSNGGNIVAGAGTQVTLDMFGDGLTQVTINVAPTVDSVIAQENAGSMIADGGQILLRTAATAGGTGGFIAASGLLRAQSIANANGRIELTSIGGPVIVGAPGIYDDVSSPYTAGLIDVSGGPGETGGSVLIQGNGVLMVNDDATPTSPTDPFSVGSMINASGDAGGGQVEIQSSDGVTMYGLSRIIADADAGTAGQVSVAAVGGILIQGDISATTKVDGDGGSVGLLSSTGNLFVIGTISATGANDGGSVLMSAMNGGLAIDGFVSANGGTGNGGQIAGVAETVVLTEDSGVSADGGAGAGGTVGFRATNALAAYGLLSAHGNTAGGSIITASDGTFDIRGLLVDAGATNGTAGSWLLSAPSLTVVNGTDVGGVATPDLGDSVQDAEINYAFLTGTSVVLQSQTDVDFNGAQLASTSSSPLSFGVDAEGWITGLDFSIIAQGGALDMAFNANASGGDGGIFFSDAVLSSYGGNIAMYGDSDPVNGRAGLGDGSGIYLNAVSIDSNGGDVLLRGEGGNPSDGANAGVVLDDSQIDSGAGSIVIDGLGSTDEVSGVAAMGSSLRSAGGVIDIRGIAAGDADGVYFMDTEVFSGGGSASVFGVGGAYGVYFSHYAGLQSGGGDIMVHGEGGTEAGVYLFGGIDSGGGGIDVYGYSAASDGLIFEGGFFDGISSAGGDIRLEGVGATGGAVLVGSGYGANSIDSAGGLITIIGTASDADAVGVLLSSLAVVAGSGDVLIDGVSPAGIGILFENGASMSTTTGAIGLYGVGADFGLDIADGAIDTDSGDITLDGTATSATAIAGVRVTGDGLVTNGGDITVTGTSAGGVGVQLGDGGAFAIGSGGGAITIEGTGIDAGVLMDGNQVASGGGAVSIAGTGGDLGVSLYGSDIDSAGGDIEIEGTASATGGAGVSLYDAQLVGGAGDVIVRGTAAGGIGIQFGYGSAISTTTGAIGLYGTGADFGLDITDGALDTDSGDITLDGTATAATAIAGVRVTGDGLVTNGGDITVTGTSAGGVGVQLGDGSTFAIGSGGGAISIEGTGVDAGVLMDGNQVASGGGAVSIIGSGATTGVSLDDSEIDSGGGSIDIEGSASAAGGSGVSLSNAQLLGGAGEVTVRGSAAAGVGVLLANGAGISTTTGAIGLYGTGADFGLDITDGALDTDSGDITLDGTATAATAIAGVRVTGDGLVTNGGDIRVTGTSTGGVGVQLGDGSTFAIGSGGGAISIEGTGVDAGVLMDGNQLASGGGAVSITGTGATTGVSLDGSDIDSTGGDIDVQGEASASGVGIDLTDARLFAGAGDIRLFGDAALGTGVNFAGQSAVSTTTGDISITGIGASIGLDIAGGELATDSGHIDLRGRGTSSGAIGLRIGQGVGIATDGGGIELSGQGNAASGLVIGDGASVDAGDSLIVLRATSTNATDTIDIRGNIHSGVGVNLRPGGVDLQGELTQATGDSIYLGSGSGGFVLSNAELALIDTPELIIGSNLHAGAIQVLGGISREGNLTLQNDGGSGGIDLQAALDVGDGTLALSSGGSIVQTSAGVITAHSLLAQAGGDVLLASAMNDVADTTLAGSAGGDFEFQDANTLAIGSVSAIGFDASSGQLSSFGASGIEAGGDAFVRNLQGDLTLNAGVTATNIDLVTAGRLQNVAGASLVASGDWRVWASTWEGETRGGLAGDGNLPNLYGCAYLGACGVTVSSGDNHFIYVQQPIALVTFDNATREYGLPNPLFTFNVTGAILGDTAANVATGSATTTATIGSDVGNYAITGNFLSAAGYQIQFVPGTLAITPATLLFTADGAVRYLGFPNPEFTGTVSGFRNGDTIASVFGDTVIWSSPAGPLSPIGYYPVVGGTSARNYVFAQAEGNATALQVILLPSVPGRPVNFIRESINTYVYDRNFGGAPVCAVNASIDDTGLASAGDGLSTEWTKVRARPNLTNCFDSERENGCGSF